MFQLDAWHSFRAFKDRRQLRSWLKGCGNAAKNELRRGILEPPKTGRFYGRHRASAPGQYPANKTGHLYRSVRSRIASAEVSVGSTVFYGRFLADGTSRMQPRKMSRAALEKITPLARSTLRNWLYFQRSGN